MSCLEQLAALWLLIGTFCLADLPSLDVVIHKAGDGLPLPVGNIQVSEKGKSDQMARPLAPQYRSKEHANQSTKLIRFDFLSEWWPSKQEAVHLPNRNSCAHSGQLFVGQGGLFIGHCPRIQWPRMSSSSDGSRVSLGKRASLPCHENRHLTFPGSVFL